MLPCMKSKSRQNSIPPATGQPQRINWFPGHMAKALREAEQKLKNADLILEVRDARAPLASTNAELLRRLGDKPRIVILNKANLADPENLRLWIEWLRLQPVPFAAVNALDRQSLKKIPKLAKEMAAKKFQKLIRRGIRPPAARLMVLGLPNTGKSTLINGLANRKATVTGARPGVTQRQHWVIVESGLELLDTPGIMPPRIADDHTGLTLTAIHCIKDEIPGPQKVAVFLLKLLAEQAPQALKKRYGFSEPNPERALEEVALKAGFLKGHGVTDLNQAASRILKDFRSGSLAPLIFEEPPEPIS